MPLDTNVFDKIHTFSDYQKADQDFQLKKLLSTQALQTGGIDVATKTNIYKTQLLAGAVAGGQPAYDQARQTLQSQGIDTSEFAPDVQTASQQVNAARLAQAPAMQLLNTALKADSNNIQRGTLTGDVPPPFNPSVILGGNTPAPPIAAAPSPQAARSVTPSQGKAAITADDFNQLFAPQPPDVQAAADAKYGAPQTNVMPNAMPGTTPGVPAPAQPINNGLPGAGNTVVGTSAPPFIPPANDPSRSLQANQDIYKNALDAYNNRQDVIAAKAAAGESGKASVEYGEKSAVATEMVSRLDKNFDAMLASNPDVPQSRWAVNASQKAWLSQNFGDQSSAAAYGAFSKVNKAQILNGLQELVSSGAIRNSRPLIQLVADVNAIDENAAPAIRSQQIRTVQTEMHNLATQAQNINARMTGGQVAPYQDLPPEANVSTFKNGDIADNPQTGESLVYMDGAWKPLSGKR